MDAINDLTAFIARDGTELVTDSRAVALAFKKRHKNVLRTIDRMRNSKHPEIAEHARLNFEPTMYTVPGGKGATRQETMHKMTAKGLSELAMSFSGDESRIIRIRFLNAFEARAHPPCSSSAQQLPPWSAELGACSHSLFCREIPCAAPDPPGRRSA